MSLDHWELCKLAENGATPAGIIYCTKCKTEVLNYPGNWDACKCTVMQGYYDLPKHWFCASVAWLKKG